MQTDKLLQHICAGPAGGPVAFRARLIVPLAGEKAARGKALRAPLASLENCWLMAEKGRIAAIGKNLPPHCHKRDLGDVAILPPLANAHTHLQLSWLGGKTLWRHGFTLWLKSMLPLLMPAIGAGFGSPAQLAALDNACKSLTEQTAYAGDVGGSITGALAAAQAAAHKHDLTITHFCEWFGFAPDGSPWPERCHSEIAQNGDTSCAPSAHGLYSTSAANVRKAHAFCKRHGRVFSIHLAESEEETELLCAGTGPLAELYRGCVLPPNWRPPGMRPLPYAQKLGILGHGTLAVHGVQLDQKEIELLAASGAALCLCPRSNYNLAVGEAPVGGLMASGTLLCLGTDGLTSSTDLDIRNEALFLRRKLGLPWRILWRMATVNGAAALGMPFSGLAVGQPARFSVWPLDEFERNNV